MASQQLRQGNGLESHFHHPLGTHTLRARGSISVATREKGIRILDVPLVLEENLKTDATFPVERERLPLLRPTILPALDLSGAAVTENPTPASEYTYEPRQCLFPFSSMFT